MTVTVKLFAYLRENLPEGAEGKACSREIEGGATVGDVLHGLQIPDTLSLLIFRNAAHASRDEVLEDGDVLAVFPPTAGG
jgi:molybdopterin converting factor small subunit